MDERAAIGTVRRMLLGLLLLGSLGLALELVFLEHWDSPWQWLPFVGLAVGVVATASVAARPRRATVRFFQGVMGAFVALGAVGLFLHYTGNVSFEREMDPSAGGLALVREALFGATPVLAPGALAQLGLMGLAAMYRHPSTRTSNP